MKSKSQELVDKSIAAMISAIEIYNKPDFKYREETFSILAINAWELLLKAKWIKDNGNKVSSICIFDTKFRKNGEPYKHKKIRLTTCGNPFTFGLDYLAKKMVERKILADNAHKNIVALCEIRDSSVHFYNRNNLFAIRLQEIGSASVKNFAKASQAWFSVDLLQYNFYLMPLAFISPTSASPVFLSVEEKNLAAFISSLESSNDPTADYAVSVNVEMKFSQSKVNDALKVQISSDPSAPKMHLSFDHWQDKFTLDYEKLITECKARYSNFSANQKFHDLKKPLKADSKYCHTAMLDPSKPKGLKKEWYSKSVFTIFDKHYTKKV